jgi:glycosyltransferase involved in cell wall biosynthesis
VPSVVTVHDVSYCAHPEWFSWREGTRRRVLTRLAAQRATTVVTVSNFSKEEIVRHLRVPPSRVRVIHSGPSGLPVDGAPGDTPPREPLVLYVGSILSRRHVPELVEGFARLARRRTDVRLVLVGEPRGTPAVDVVGALRAADLGDRVAHLGFVDDATLARLYRRASAFAFLSAYEGFGLTPLDALQAGVPPIVLDTVVAREVYGGAAHYISHPAPALIEAALDCVLSDPRERERLAAEARTRLARLTWHESARQTLDALREAAG